MCILAVSILSVKIVSLWGLMLFPSVQSPLWGQVRSSDKWWRVYREIGNVTVLRVDLSAHTEREQSALTWLDAGERLSWQRYLHLGARRRFLLCRAALRIALCERLACKNTQLAFGVAQHGKPFALVDGVAAAVSFNVSHSGEHGLIALAPTGRLGVDVEKYAARRHIDQLVAAAGVLTAHEREELAHLHGNDKERMFVRLWTIKEALAKALGTGLRIGLAELAVPPPLFQGATSTFQFPHEPRAKWSIAYIGNAEFAAAVVQELL